MSRYRRMSWLLIASLLVALFAAGPFLPRAGRLIFGRAPELIWLWRWQRDYPKLVEASTDAAHSAQPLPSGNEADLVAAAIARASEPTRYDPAYIPLGFPGGDVPADTGVCTDLVVRAYRDLGLDLQAAVNADMRQRFADYPPIWGSTDADASIDHRRVPNLMVFFSEQGQVLPIGDRGTDFEPGDVVTWHLGAGSTHIGIVTDRIDPESGNPRIAHHVGGHPTVDDALFRWRIIGRFALRPTTPIPLPDGFKTITNQQYGFTLQVPDDWIVESPAYGNSIAGSEFYGGDHFVLGLSPGVPHGDWPSIVAVTPGSVVELLSKQDYRWRQHWAEQAREPIQIGSLSGTQVLWQNGASTRHLEHPSGRYSLTFEGFPIGGPETDPEVTRQWQAVLSSVRFLDEE